MFKSPLGDFVILFQQHDLPYGQFWATPKIGDLLTFGDLHNEIFCINLLDLDRGYIDRHYEWYIVKIDPSRVKLQSF